MSNQKRVVFQDLNNTATYRFLEASVDKSEIERLVSKFTLNYPSPDLAIFRCEFASVDTFSENGLRFPSEEVTEDVLKSLSIKPIDYNHDRKINIGTWLEASRDEKTIYAFGCLWKSSFPNEFEKVKSQLEKGEAYISNEAYVDREFLDNDITKNPNLRKRNGRNIHFCGGAILDRKKPAFSNARVLEFCSIFGDKIEGDKMDIVEIVKQLEQSSKEEIVTKLRSLVKTEEEFSTVLKDEKVIELFTKFEIKTDELKFVEEKSEEVAGLDGNNEGHEGATGEVKVEPTAEPVKVEASADVLATAPGQDGLVTTQEVTVNNVQATSGTIDGKYIEVVEKTNDSLVIFYVDGVEKSQTKYLIKEVRVYTQSEIDAKDQEINTLKNQLEESNKIVIEYNSMKAEQEKQKALELEANRQEKIKSRKEMLKEYSEGLSDEDILDDVKFEASMKDKKIKDLEKENSELKAKVVTVEKSEEQPKGEEKPTLEKGDTTPTVKEENTAFVTQAKINEMIDNMRFVKRGE